MSRTRWTAFAAALLLWQSPLHAASVTIEGDDPRKTITVTIESSTVDAVLKDLQSKYKFDVGGLQYADKSEPISATMSGDLRSVLERLLRNWNYMIVRSSGDGSIEKLTIIDAKFGSVPSKGGQQAGGDGHDKTMQAQSGAPADAQY
jgi:hypothetical protein